MTVIALTSVRGSPGVTTAALGLTLVWPRPVLLVEADVSGGSSVLAGWLRATVPHDRSLVDAAIAHQRGNLEDRLHTLTVPLPPDQADSSKRLLPAIPQAVQSASLAPLWGPLAGLSSALDEAGTDVIVDAGRLSTHLGPLPLLHAADTVLLVTRATLPAISAVAAGLPPLKSDLATLGTGEETLALLTIGQPGPGPGGLLYSPAEIHAALETPVLGTVSHDPVAAEVLSLGAPPPRRFDRSSLMRSLRSVADAAGHHAQGHRARLRTPSQQPTGP